MSFYWFLLTHTKHENNSDCDACIVKEKKQHKNALTRKVKKYDKEKRKYNKVLVEL